MHRWRLGRIKWLLHFTSWANSSILHARMIVYMHVCLHFCACVCARACACMYACMHAWRWMTQSNYLSQLQHLFLARQHPNIFTRNLSRSPRP